MQCKLLIVISLGGVLTGCSTSSSTALKRNDPDVLSLQKRRVIYRDLTQEYQETERNDTTYVYSHAPVKQQELTHENQTAVIPEFAENETPIVSVAAETSAAESIVPVSKTAVMDPTPIVASVAKSAKPYSIPEVTALSSQTDGTEPVVQYPDAVPAVPGEVEMITFKLLPAQTLKENLLLWCTEHDWTLVWNSAFDYPIIAQATFSVEDFVAAIISLSNEFRFQSIPLTIQLGSNNVVRVSGGPKGI